LPNVYLVTFDVILVTGS